MVNQILPEDQSKQEQAVYLYDHLQVDLFTALDQLYHFASTHYSDTIKARTSYILAHIEVTEQLKEDILPQLVWWVIFKEPVVQEAGTIFGRFLQENQDKLRDKGIEFRHILTSWQAISPGFYITKTVTKSRRSGTLMNIVGLTQYKIIVCNEIFQPLERGELVTGFLLPIGDNMYTSPVDLFHISPNDTPRVTWEVLLHFHQHTISSAHPPPSKLYLPLIQSALEVINFNKMFKN